MPGATQAAAVAFYGTLGSLTGLLVAEHAYEESVDQLTALEDLYQDPGADPEAVGLVREAIDEQVASAEDRRQVRNILAGITAGFWLWNVIDAGIGTRSAGRAAGGIGGGTPGRRRRVSPKSPACSTPFWCAARLC